MGLLSSRGVPAWHPVPAAVKEACSRAIAHCTSRGKSIEKLAIQFALANPDIATTLVGTASPHDVEQNVRCLDEPIDRELLAEVREILKPVHDMTWPSGRAENN
jgi:L-galactose dehydrogenase